MGSTKKAIDRLKGLLFTSDRLGSYETSEIRSIVTILERDLENGTKDKNPEHIRL